MKVKKTNSPRIKRKSFALVTKFAVIIGISIFYSIFFITAYNIYASAPIVEQYKKDKQNEINAISKTIQSEYQNIFFAEGISDDFERLVRNLYENNLVLHVGIIDKATKQYIWSSVEAFQSKSTDIHSPWAIYELKEFFKLIEGNISIKRITFEDETNILVITFAQETSILNLVNLLKNGNYMLAATFIIFGFLSGSLLAKQVTKPIEELVIGVWEFSKGNLNYRTTIKSDDEIGILAKAFNYMAEKLNELYASMEQKVRERTAQLSSKNEELNKAYEELKDAQALLVHNEKMRSLGELVAGVAHELNNPINFIYGNMTHLKEYSENLMEIISKYEEAAKTAEGCNFEEVEKFKEEVEYDFIQDDIRDLIQSCIEGAERSKHIVLELKNFSRLDQGVIKEINVNESIDSTLNILNNKYKNRINIIKEYGELPLLNCYAGQINQVFMNILDNAAQAIDETGEVHIRTRQEGENVVVEIEDNGSGIDEETLPKIFDPFFTTKEVGSGSGMGLSISYKIIKSHNGNIEVESEVGKGTKFKIIVPLYWEEQQYKHEHGEAEELENLEELEKATNE